MGQKEAKARIKINDMLKEAGWKFFDAVEGKANIILENNAKITESYINALGENFETTKNGFIDFLLLDKKGYPFIVLEAKSEDKHALAGKEQARKYAQSQHCRFIILSNGNSHYFWDLQRGNPVAITKFPSPESVEGYADFKPNPAGLTREVVEKDYIALTQKPDYKTDPAWISETTRGQYIQNNSLRFLRDYQLRAIKAIQESVKQGKDRFLFEMATGTGKTLVAAAVIKLFLRTGNARRVLFLVDRLELENQAKKAFASYLKNDYQTVVYKENRDDWRKAEIVISTVQTYLSKNRYKRLFSPDDFDLVISDEAHRSIGGNSRAVFEYFIGYKLGLTATPKDYLKNFDPDNQNTPREWERRILLDTYKTFGCENGIPTYRYSLTDGVDDKVLINPIVVDARTDITAQMLSDQGYAVVVPKESDVDESEEVEETFIKKDFEKIFFSDETNRVLCETFLLYALRDPISDEIGKSIVFCVSQNHASKITQLLNEVANKMFPGKYQSDFAVQITSWIPDRQQFTTNFTNNNLCGSANFIESYRTSKARVAVTVGMMTTGYDCPDILNLAFMRPVFSPTDFIQIKGRGTRKHDFSEQITDPAWKKNVGAKQKTNFKLFDFFANCEYFEKDFNYNEVLTLPRLGKSTSTGIETGGEGVTYTEGYESTRPDFLTVREERLIGPEGMRVDRMYFQKFGEQIKQDGFAIEKAEVGDLEAVVKHIEENIFDKPEDFFNLEKLRKSISIDRRVSLREIVEVIFGLRPYFKTKDELLDEEFDKFDSRYMPDEKQFNAARNFFKTYVLDPEFRTRVDEGNFAYIMGSHAGGEFLRKLTIELRNKIIEYIKDYISFNQFV
jgi:type I restriction enzyme R subunit